MDSIILSSNYFGTIPYHAALVHSKSCTIDLGEKYVKQSQRNRTTILSANGKQVLSVPIMKNSSGLSKEYLMNEVRISYIENWQKDHWKAIESAYQHAPFFIHYADVFSKIIFTKYDLLIELNFNILDAILKIIDLKIPIFKLANCPIINSKKDLRITLNQKEIDLPFQPYCQVFSNKYPFQSNLSIIDLIMNEGPNSRFYLNELSF